MMQLPILPLVRMFYGQPSTFLWKDDVGSVHSIVQAEGGEQGDPLMPALFALGIAPALETVEAEMHTGERVRAFLDDVYVTSQPPRVAQLLDRLQHHMFAQHIRLNPSKRTERSCARANVAVQCGGSTLRTYSARRIAQKNSRSQATCRSGMSGSRANRAPCCGDRDPS